MPATDESQGPGRGPAPAADPAPAQPAAEEPAVGERHLLVRVVHDMAEPKSTSLKLGPDESLRVLLVFADRL